MRNDELAELAGSGGPYRGKAVFELVDRARADDDAASRLGELSLLAALRGDRLFHSVSLAWAAIIGLLAAETPHARTVAYAAFAALSAPDQAEFLAYVKADRIEEALPRL
ncbi:hypothetical protein C1I93_13790 [Micromonospora endophytica]|uniref:Uncharacterized protein n=2 Tax=Micromonospora endophytica TaxID=515350 RepID=A0A2W2CAL8_9ACTN|nr:hypothetical protein C1I93_13790 [Micromonospora endophytica]RIW48300.1 hypothetical protein D3H59_07490 [Micromonospora endophytica]